MKRNQNRERSLSPHVYSHGEDLEFDVPEISKVKTYVATTKKLDEANEAKPEKKAPVAQVFQGRGAWDGASWFELALFRYMKPLVVEATKDDIYLEQLGNIDPQRDIATFAPILEETF